MLFRFVYALGRASQRDPSRGDPEYVAGVFALSFMLGPLHGLMRIAVELAGSSGELQQPIWHDKSAAFLLATAVALTLIWFRFGRRAAFIESEFAWIRPPTSFAGRLRTTAVVLLIGAALAFLSFQTFTIFLLGTAAIISASELAVRAARKRAR